MSSSNTYDLYYNSIVLTSTGPGTTSTPPSDYLFVYKFGIILILFAISFIFGFLPIKMYFFLRLETTSLIIGKLLTLLTLFREAFSSVLLYFIFCLSLLKFSMNFLNIFRTLVNRVILLLSVYFFI